MRATVIRLAGPALAEMFLITAVSMADMMMVGRIGPAAITAVGLTTQPMLLFFAAFQALYVGTTALVARFVGGGEGHKSTNVVWQTMMLTLVLGALFSGVAMLVARPVMVLMGAERDVLMVGGVGYFRVVGAGILFETMSMGLAAALRGAGDTKSPMVIDIAANLINILGNWLLIFGHLGFPAWGVVGAGVSTTVARLCAALMYLFILFNNKRLPIRLSLKDKIHFDRDIVRRMLTVGWPAALEQLMLRGGQVAYARVISGLGTTIFAAHQIGFNILNLTFQPGTAFAIAATTIVGQKLGAGDPDGAEKGAKEAQFEGLVTAAIMAAVFVFFGRNLAWLYSNDPAVIANVANVLRLYALAMPFQSTQFILAGGLRGAGDTRWPLYATAAGVWFGRFAFAALLINVFHMGLAGAWIAMIIDQAGRATFISLRYRSGKWKLAKV
jgi:putative MATE family efflux protein